jgi:hypothetical protein
MFLDFRVLDLQRACALLSPPKKISFFDARRRFASSVLKNQDYLSYRGQVDSTWYILKIEIQ